MRTNIEIDAGLMSDALKAGPYRTKREAVEQGLRILVRLARQAEARSLRGTINWVGDLDEMRRD